jgi:CubicO group peptidase (beta-lactamase class C family)
VSSSVRRFPFARTGVLIGVGAMLFLAPGGRAAVAAPPASGSVRAAIADAVAAFQQKTGTPGVVVAVYDARQFGTSGYVAPFGVTSFRGTAPVTGDTVFQIGSITKVFSGTLYGAAIGRGYATPETTAYKALGSPASLAHAAEFQKLTLRELATHTAGFPDNVDARAADPLFSGSSTIPNSMLAFYNSLTPALRTGCYQYSSAGFITLGYALADSWPGTLHGKYPAILDAEISKPLGLRCTNTVVPASCVSRSSGVTLSTTPFKAARHSATDVKSTGNDMLKWIEANLGVGTSTPQLLANAIATAQKPVGTFPSCTSGKGVTVGLAWQESPLNLAPGRPTMLWKDGATGYGGESAMLVLVPSQRVGIAILTNGLGAGGPDALAKSLAAKILAADAGVPASADGSPKPHHRKRHAHP